MNFSLTNTAGAAAIDDGQCGHHAAIGDGVDGFAVPLAVTVKDAGNNPHIRSERDVYGPGCGRFRCVQQLHRHDNGATNAGGVASAPFTANATAGGPYN